MFPAGTVVFSGDGDTVDTADSDGERVVDVVEMAVVGFDVEGLNVVKPGKTVESKVAPKGDVVGVGITDIGCGVVGLIVVGRADGSPRNTVGLSVVWKILFGLMLGFPVGRILGLKLVSLAESCPLLTVGEGDDWLCVAGRGLGLGVVACIVSRLEFNATVVGFSVEGQGVGPGVIVCAVSGFEIDGTIVGDVIGSCGDICDDASWGGRVGVIGALVGK